MAINKIRIRNLDDEVLNYFYKSEDKIGYDQLDENVVTDIKNGGGSSSGGTSYNDSELRNRIINLESTALTKTEAESTYAAKADYDDSNTVDSKIEDAKQTIRDEFEGYKDDFIPMQDGIITENLLSYELKNKINSSSGSSSGSTGGSGDSGVSSSDIAEINKKITQNTDDINTIKNTINTNVYLKSESITIDNLEDSLQSLINNARQNDVLITMDDLDESVKNAINNGGAAEVAADEVINAMYDGSENGQVLIVSKEEGTDSYTVTPKYIFATDVFIFKMDEQYLDDEIVIESPDEDEEEIRFDSAKTYAQNNGYKYIADLQREVLLEYDSNTAAWTEHDAAEDVYNKLSGTFVVSYPEGTISYCKRLREVVEVFNPDDYADADEIENIVEYFDDIDARLAALEGGGGSSSGTTIEEVSAKVAELEENMATKTEIEEISTKLEELMDRITAIEEQIGTSAP